MIINKTIQYGSLLKQTARFYDDSSLLQQFSSEYTDLTSIDLYVNKIPKNTNDYVIRMLIADEQQNIFFSKDLEMKKITATGYFNIPTNIYLTKNKNYFICLDGYGDGTLENSVSFSLGYRKKMKNFFVRDKFSLGQLCFKLNYAVEDGE